MGDLDRALPDLNKAIALSPQYIFALMERGDAYQTKGEYDLAAADYARVLAIQPNNAVAQERQRAAMALKQASVSSAPAQKPSVASAASPPQTSGVQIAQETDIAKLFSTAETQYRKGDLDGTMAALDRITAIDANNAKAFQHKGEVLLRKGDLEQAVFHFDHSIKLNPDSIDAYILRCATLIDLGRLEAAMLDGEHLVRVAANDARSYNFRGFVRLQQGQLKSALDDFDLSIAINPAAGYAYENRALAHKSMGNRELALADLSRALSVNTKSARALTFRAQIYIADGDLDRAIAEFKQALAIDPNFKPAQLGLQSALVSKSMSQIDKVRVNG